MNRQKPPLGRHIIVFCKNCSHKTPHEFYFSLEEVEHLVCYECGSVTHIHATTA